MSCDNKTKKIVFFLRKISDDQKEVTLLGVYKKKKIQITIQNYFTYHFHTVDTDNNNNNDIGENENDKTITLKFLLGGSIIQKVIECKKPDCNGKGKINDDLQLSEFFLHSHQLSCMSFIQIEFAKEISVAENFTTSYDDILNLKIVDDKNCKPIYNVSTLVSFNISKDEHMITDVLVFTNTYQIEDGVSKKIRISKFHFKLNITNQKTNKRVSLKKNYYRKKKEFFEEKPFYEAIAELLDNSDVIFENDYSFKSNSIRNILKKINSYQDITKKFVWITDKGIIDTFLTKYVILHNFMKKNEISIKKSDSVIEYVSISESKNIPFLSNSELEKKFVIEEERSIEYIFGIIVVHFNELEKLFLIETYDNMKLYTGFIFNYCFEMVPLFINLINRKIFVLRTTDQKDKKDYWIFKELKKHSLNEKVSYGELDKVQGFYENVVILDLNAFYPSLSIIFDLCSSNTKENINDEIFVSKKGLENEGLVPKIFKELLDKRNLNKKIGNFTKEKCYKTLSNSFYGFWTTENNPKRFPLLSQRIINASKYVKKIILNYLSQEKNLKFFFSNYDGFFIQFSETKNFKEDSINLLNALNKRLSSLFDSDIIKLKIDKLCKRIMFLNSNKYIYRLEDDSKKEFELISSKGFSFESQFLNNYVELMNFITMRDNFKIETLEKNFYIHYSMIKVMNEKKMKLEYIFEIKKKGNSDIFKINNKRNTSEEQIEKLTDLTLKYYEILLSLNERELDHYKKRLEKMKISYTPSVYKTKAKEELSNYVFKNFKNILNQNEIINFSKFIKIIHYRDKSYRRNKSEEDKLREEKEEKGFILQGMKDICAVCSENFISLSQNKKEKIVNDPSECVNKNCIIKKKYESINF